MSDQSIRQQALNPKQSYIIQAPAGSGKTELLIQRFLKLLSVASTPEEIIAITFTRKAAIEMRERILEALNSVKNRPKPEDNHKALTWILAKAVLERNKHFHWQLETNSNRLRILTIDALAHQICSKAPVLTGFGAPPSTKEGKEIEVFYRYAVEQLLMLDNHTHILEQLLLHLDNKADLLEKLLIKMLSQREHWMGYIVDYYSNPDSLKEGLEKALEFIALDAMQRAHDLIKKTLAAPQLIPLIQFAGFNMKQAKPNNPISTCCSLIKLPKINIKNFLVWKGIANLLLTKSGKWRKKIDKSIGFPVDMHYKQQKLQMQNLLEQLSTNNPLQIALQEVQNCPPIRYTESQWRILYTLISLLPLLVARLQAIFYDHNVVDFTEIALGALRALGNTQQPSDYALQLDTQIYHLLIDEFQDTSIIQFRLIEALITRWQPNDGRTLFLVGDPMQSIYRFRQAEVSLFLQVKAKGIGNIQLIPLILYNNFRSQKALIEWFNVIFKHLFPTEANNLLGSIPYSSSHAANDNFRLRTEINFHSLASTQNEAQKIIKIIQNCRSKDKNTTIALLVRSRSHLIEIIPALRNTSFSFNAVEVEELGNRTEIQDLLSLTRAFHHLGDRIAWLAILRAPWCGLPLKDIYHLCLHSGDNPLWCAMQNMDTLEGLTSDAKKRLRRIIPILSHALHNRDRLPLAMWIERVWIALGGPACLNKSVELVSSVRAYFNLLETIENEFTIERLTEKLQKLYTPIDDPNPQAIQIMTIHKAKGLEFDHVIIPSLERTPKEKDDLLLQWLERPLPTGSSDLILAPLKASEEKLDPLYTYLKQVEKKKSDNEIVRLFYVAATRAKIGLHFLLTIKRKTAQSVIVPPSNGSFANLLWNVCEEKIKKSIPPYKEAKILEPKKKKWLYRLSSEWTAPISFKTLSHPSNAPVSFSVESLGGQCQTIIGNVIHQLLEKISIDGIEFWNEKRIISSKPFIKRRLFQAGISFSQLHSSIALIEKAIRLTLSDPRGRWILSPHFQHQSEYHISTIQGSEVVHYVIDRTFIDDRGMRWVIDYKSTTPIKQNLSLFLQQQRILYESQLNRYAKAFQLLEDRSNKSVKLGLYFPLYQGWCEWKT